MELQAAYWKEREQIDTIARPDGFITYKFLDDGAVYIVDVYVMPSARSGNLSRELEADVLKIASDAGAERVFGSVQLNLVSAPDSIAFLTRMGYRFHSLDGHKMFFTKEL